MEEKNAQQTSLPQEQEQYSAVQSIMEGIDCMELREQRFRNAQKSQTEKQEIIRDNHRQVLILHRSSIIKFDDYLYHSTT
jgi:hypothetical protein